MGKNGKCGWKRVEAIAKERVDWENVYKETYRPWGRICPGGGRRECYPLQEFSLNSKTNSRSI